MSLCSFTEKIDFQAPVGQVFELFTDTDQLGKSLPPSVSMKIVNRTSRHLKQGTFLELQARFLGAPVQWKSYIHSFSKNRHIAYIWQPKFSTSWEHDYYFEAISNTQTRVTECIVYRLPFRILGNVFNQICFRPFLKWVFAYRRTALKSILQNMPRDSSSSGKTTGMEFKK